MTEKVSVTCSQVFGNCFVLFILCVISFVYYGFIVTFYPLSDQLRIQVLLFFFHLSLFMLLWSFFKAMMTDPGQVPPLWGFSMGDCQSKRKRYCLMCHVFKPERTHHCSACNRCVLNMDHHCPWINNCIGFYNRKFFLLLIFYVVICTYIVTIGLLQPVWVHLNSIIQTRNLQDHTTALVLSSYTLNLMLNTILSFFFKFHLKLLFRNVSTIESMENKNLLGTYDIGWRENFVQVFGRNPWLWLLPMIGKTGLPVGDGVVWVKPEQQIEQERKITADSVASNR